MLSAAIPLRNVQVISSPGVGGREIDAPVLARQFRQQGCPTWVMCRPGTLVERLAREWGIPTLALPLGGYLNPTAVLRAARFFRRERIEVILCHWSRDLSNLILAAGLAGGIPIAMKKHVYATDPKKDVFHDWVYRHVDLVIAVSNVVAENVAQTVRIDPQRIVTVYNGVDIHQTWNPECVRDQNLRPEWGLPAACPVLGYVGRLNRGKRPHWILEAFAALAHRFPAWHLVLAGQAVGSAETEYVVQLRERIRALALESRVHFIGYRMDMPAVMRSLDVVACASEFESLGMVVVEAMAMEKPVLGPNSGGIPEIIEPGVNGDLFDTSQLVDLTEKLAGLMADSDRRQRLGKQGRKTVALKFNLERNARTILDLLHDLVQRRKKTSGSRT